MPAFTRTPVLPAAAPSWSALRPTATYLVRNEASDLIHWTSAPTAPRSSARGRTVTFILPRRRPARPLGNTAAGRCELAPKFARFEGHLSACPKVIEATARLIRPVDQGSRPLRFAVAEQHRSLALFQGNNSSPPGYSDFAAQRDDAYPWSIGPPHTVVPRTPIAATGVCIRTFAPLSPSIRPPTYRNAPLTTLSASSPRDLNGS
jgi:hypothetical protein